MEKTITTTVNFEIGQTWINGAGYKLKILDIGESFLWLEWENGVHDAWKFDSFIAQYSLYSKLP